MIKINKNDSIKYTRMGVAVAFKTLCYVMLIAMCFVFLYPFVYMIATSLKSYQDLMNAAVYLIPRSFKWSNYKTAFEAVNYMRSLVNSVSITLVCTVAHVFMCSMVGYGFARFKFKGSGLLFLVVILSILIPAQVLIVPQYFVYAKVGLTRSSLPLILPCFFGYGLRGGLFIFLYRQYFLRFPKTLEEAAKIDGCTPMHAYWSVAFPTAASQTLVTIVLSAVWHWNDYFEPSIYLKNSNQFLLPQRLPDLYALISSMEQGSSGGNLSSAQFIYHEGVVMAGTVIVLMPLLIMYIILQRRFVEGVERSGLVE
ncbi:MAG: carbohydrate ABC transporter permease [Acutalibacteraceae bacterium]|nr:carbohydrate ABC transporter permease [Acutalibacteraceae bacterium]